MLSRSRRFPWIWISIVLSVLIAIPIFAILYSLTDINVNTWVYLWETRLFTLIWNTLRLTLCVALLSFLLGTSLAWLVTMYDFPAKKWFEGLLLLPLAMPGYVIAFVFLSQWDISGPFPQWLRQNWGITYWPDIRSFFWVSLLLSLVLYPYVYLLSRVAFKEQNISILEAARCLGTSRKQLFWKVALPMARPSIFVGTSFVMMETLADFGTVGIFSYDTFTTAIYQMWYGLFNQQAAIQLASFLLLFALGIFYLEEQSRKNIHYYQTSRNFRPPKPFPLFGWKASIAFLYPTLVVGFAFFYPVIILCIWALESYQINLDSRYIEWLMNTMGIAAVAAVITMIISLFLAYGKRIVKKNWYENMTRFICMGYALPGSVVAVGVLVPLSFFDHWINQVYEQYWQGELGLIFTGTMFGMLFAYLVRFLSVGFKPVDTHLQKVTPVLDMAGASLGANRKKILQKIHFPLIRGGIFTGVLIIFVDVMKEMPATLLLRPFGVETLATRIWEMTAESYWEDAALPALTIVLIATLPVILLIRMKEYYSSDYDL